MPKTTEQNQEIREQTEKKILAEALHLFARKGLSATKISELAEHMHISQGLIYRYFPSKEDLFKKLVEISMKENREGLSILFDEELPAKDNIRTLSSEIMKYVYKEKNPFAEKLVIVLQYILEVSRDHKEIEEYTEVPFGILKKLICKGQKEGSVIDGDPDALCMLYWGTLQYACLDKVMRKNSFKPYLTAEMLNRILLIDEAC